MWIDPILLRPIAPEPKSYVTLARQYVLGNSATLEQLSGGDVSSWQGEMDWNKYFDNGMNYTIIRAMINGYADTQFDRNANILTKQNRWFGVYGATGWPTLANALPYARKLASLVQGVGNLAVWWDSELSGELNSYQMAKYNSEMMGELGALLPGRIREMYTRQTFWDSHVAPGNWSKYPLAAARYNEQLTGPWSDGRYKFRDWTEWRYFQDSQWWDGYKFGAKSRYIDHLRFNGGRDKFVATYNLDGSTTPPEPEIPEMWNFAVITDQLNYRTEPRVYSTTYAGRFTRGHIIQALRTVNPEYNDFWLEFRLDGNTYYSALTYKGTQYCKQVE